LLFASPFHSINALPYRFIAVLTWA
jgi:hypothetical protein